MPSGQAAQLVAPTPAVELSKVPGVQLPQAEAASAATNCPAGQEEHSEAPSTVLLNFPRLHALQAVAPPSGPEKYPGGQAVQLVWPELELEYLEGWGPPTGDGEEMAVHVARIKSCQSQVSSVR